jgi:pimeloyl-ACP methyl ester carboxylesterase
MSDRPTVALCLPLPTGGTLVGDLSSTGAVGRSAVLYVHGFGSTHRGEKTAAVESECARRGWPFASFSLRGHGPSSGTLLDLRADSVQEDLDCVHAALAARGVRRLFLVGSSMGGWAGGWFARRRPEAVAALAAIAPGFNFPRGRFLRLSEPERRRWQGTGRLTVRNEGRGRDEELSFALVGDYERFGLDALAAGWTAPLLVFHGMDDDVVPFADSVAFAERADPRAEIEIRLLRPGDHRLVQHKEAMAAAVGEFFARRWPG